MVGQSTGAGCSVLRHWAMAVYQTGQDTLSSFIRDHLVREGTGG
jgi:hypothetical protein